MSYSPISTSDALTQLTAEETLEFDQVIADGVTHSVSDFATKEDLFALFLTAGTVYVRNTQNAGVWYPIGDNIASNVATATKIVDSLNGVNTNVMTLTKNLTPAMEAALTNSGANVGSTALAPITNTELVVQSTGKTLQVTTKGILTKVPYAKALTAGAAAIGVGLGIGFVEVNPELATKISNRMFGTDIDPGDISNVVENTTVWANIVDGATFLAEDFINVLKDVFIEDGVYLATSKTANTLKNVRIGVSKTIGLSNYINGVTRAPYHYNERFAYNLEYNNSARFVWLQGRYYSDASAQPPAPAYSYYLECTEDFKFNVNVTVNEGREYSSELPTAEPAVPNASSTRYGVYSTSVNSKGVQVRNNNRGSINAPLGEYTVQIPYNFPIIDCTDITNNFNDALRIQRAKAFFERGEGTLVTLSGEEVAGTELEDGATYPDSTKTLAEDYPSWWDRRATSETISDGSESSRNWLEINTSDPESQNEAQDGELKDSSQLEDAIKGIEETVDENTGLDENYDPQEQPYPNPNPEPGSALTPVTPDPPSVDNSDGESPDPTIPTLTTVVTSGLSYVYNPTLAQTQQLGRRLWTLDFVENLKKIFMDPMEAIIGMHVLYATPKTGETKDIVMGFYNTNVQSKVVTNQYVTIDCGTISVNEYFKDARDYEPYTKVSAYMPFIGVVDLKADDIINSYINISYNIDVLTGTCLGIIKVLKGSAEAAIYQYVGNCAVTVPLSTGNYTAVLTALLSVASSAIGGRAIGGAAGSKFGALKGAAINIPRMKLDVQQSGTLGANAGALGIRKPYLIIRRPVTNDAYAYNIQYGYPAFKWKKLGGCTGFTRVRSVHLENIKCTDEEKLMIETALEEGVFF